MSLDLSTPPLNLPTSGLSPATRSCLRRVAELTEQQRDLLLTKIELDQQERPARELADVFELVLAAYRYRWAIYERAAGNTQPLTDLASELDQRLTELGTELADLDLELATTTDADLRAELTATRTFLSTEQRWLRQRADQVRADLQQLSGSDTLVLATLERISGSAVGTEGNLPSLLSTLRPRLEAWADLLTVTAVSSTTQKGVPATAPPTANLYLADTPLLSTASKNNVNNTERLNSVLGLTTDLAFNHQVGVEYVPGRTYPRVGALAAYYAEEQRVPTSDELTAPGFTSNRAVRLLELRTRAQQAYQAAHRAAEDLGRRLGAVLAQATKPWAPTPLGGAGNLRSVLATDARELLARAAGARQAYTDLRSAQTANTLARREGLRELQGLPCALPATPGTPPRAEAGGNLYPDGSLRRLVASDPQAPNTHEVAWWRRFAELATLRGLDPRFWSTGLLLPSPGGPVPVKLPLVLRALAAIPTPCGVLVLLLGQRGVVTCPHVLHVEPGGRSVLLTTVRRSNLTVKEQTTSALSAASRQLLFRPAGDELAGPRARAAALGVSVNLDDYDLRQQPFPLPGYPELPQADLGQLLDLGAAENETTTPPTSPSAPQVPTLRTAVSASALGGATPPAPAPAPTVPGLPDLQVPQPTVEVQPAGDRLAALRRAPAAGSQELVAATPAELRSQALASGAGQVPLPAPGPPCTSGSRVAERELRPELSSARSGEGDGELPAGGVVYQEDDLPPWERLSPLNRGFVSYLGDFCAATRTGSGMPGYP